MSDEKERFSILSIDGGGVRGIFVAAVLDRLEQDVGVRITDHFDLIVGTSTGGVIALGLGAGLSPGDILRHYLQGMDVIFPPSRRRAPVLPMSLFRARYRPDGLQAVLREVLGETLLGDSRVPLVIPSYNIGQNSVYLFKTPHHPRLRRDWRLPMWQVGMATTAAPMYFPAYRLPEERVRLIDGGVWANNPVVVGLAEAVSLFEQPLDRIQVLSLGTTVAASHRPRRLDRGGLIHWLRAPNVAQVLLAGQGEGAFTQVQHLLGPERAYRLNPAAPESLVKLDVTDAEELLGAAAHHSRQFAPVFESVFASHRPAQNVAGAVSTRSTLNDHKSPEA